MSRGEAPFPPPAGVMPGSISVVIPALNEAALVGGAVETALRYEGAEVIVVDARSTDGTAAEAAAHGAHVLACPASRAAQQNLGALHARGEVLLFLHADARLPAGYAAQVRETLARSRVSAGAFRLRIAGRGAALRLVEAATHVRARLLRMPYGDQAIFLPRDTFVAAGGFATMPLMEDYELVRRLGRLGRVAVARAATTVSGRRWARLGVWRTTWVNRLVILGYRLGVPAATLARFYWGRA